MTDEAKIAALQQYIVHLENTLQKIAEAELRLSEVRGSSVVFSPIDKRLRDRLTALTGAVQEALEYFDDESDTVDGQDGPEANRCMQLAALMRSALGELH